MVLTSPSCPGPPLLNDGGRGCRRRNVRQGLVECAAPGGTVHRAQPDCRGVPSSLQCGGLGVWGVFWGVSTRVRIVLGSSVCGFKRVLSQVSPSRKGKLSRIPFSPSAAPLLEVREGRARERERERERELYPLEGVVPQAELSPIFFGLSR